MPAKRVSEGGGMEEQTALIECGPAPVFVVNDWQDAIRERAPKDQKRLDKQSIWGRSENVFQSYNEARAYIVARALGEVQAAQVTLKSAERRLAKCRLKFANGDEPDAARGAE